MPRVRRTGVSAIARQRWIPQLEAAATLRTSAICYLLFASAAPARAERLALPVEDY
jgi:hypothetical protein